MNLFNYLMARKGHNTSTRDDLFAYLLGKIPKVVKEVTGVTIHITNVTREKIISLWLDKESTQDGTPTPDNPIPVKVVEGYIKDGNNYVDVKVTGKNLFNPNASIINQAGLNSDGTTFGSGVSSVYNYMRVKPNTTYTLSGGIDTTHTKRICMYSEENEASFVATESTRGILITFTTTSTTNYIRIQFKTDELNSMQLEQGSVATPYEPYQESIVSIPLNGNFIGGIGDYKDTLMVDKNGKCYLEKRFIKVKLSDLNYSFAQSSSGKNIFTTKDLSEIILPPINQATKGLIMATDYTIVTQDGAWPVPCMTLLAVSGGYGSKGDVCIVDNRYSNVQDFKSNSTNSLLYYVLKEPQLIDLNYTIDLKLFIGENNISNSEDMMMTLKYY